LVLKEKFEDEVKTIEVDASASISPCRKQPGDGSHLSFSRYAIEDGILRGNPGRAEALREDPSSADGGESEVLTERFASNERADRLGRLTNEHTLMVCVYSDLV
jgi:hypothetical protein